MGAHQTVQIAVGTEFGDQTDGTLNGDTRDQTDNVWVIANALKLTNENL